MDAKVRNAIIEVYKNTCQYCLRKFANADLEVDHIDPICRGGSDSIMNLILACGLCNNRKRNLILEEPGRSLLLSIAKDRASKIIDILKGLNCNLSTYLPIKNTIAIGAFIEANDGYVQRANAHGLWLPKKLAHQDWILDNWE